MGDLEEKFLGTVKESSLGRARWNYWYQVFNYLRPFAFRKRKKTYNNISMIKNYFTIGWRNLENHKMYSAINIGGFALGVSACMLLAIYIKGELSYDSYYEAKDRTYRVIRTTDLNGVERGVYFPHPLAQALKENFAEIENVGHYSDVTQFGSGSGEIRRTDRLDNMHEDGLVYMNQGMLEILDVPFVYGNPSRALTEPYSIVITRTKAEKYFGNEDPVGKSLIINNEPSRTYTIGGVIEDFPPQSHLKFDFMMTLVHRGFWEGELDSWCCSNYNDYILVRPGTDIPLLEKKISSIIDTHMIADAIKNGNDKDHINWLKNMKLELQPIDEIYLNRDNIHDNVNHGDVRFIWLFGSIAVFIMFLACINFINLSTARAMSRAKEVGIRKVVGSMRSGLIQQFLAESFLFSFIAIIIGAGLTALLIPAFNTVVGRSLSFPWAEPLLIPIILGGSLVIGVVAGLYPSFYLSAFLPATVLKGSATAGSSKTALRSTLVVFQFTISTVLIIGTIITSRQMDYLLNTKLGFDKDRVLVLEGTKTLFEQAIPLKKELTQLADVEAVSISGYLPVHGSTRNGGSHWTIDQSGHKIEAGSQQWSVDHDYVKTMGLKIVDGRDFSEKLASDSSAIIINRSLARALQLEMPVGKIIHNYYGRFTIVGVVDDFHFESLKQTIEPLSLMLRKNRSTIAVRVRSDDMASAIASITGVWKKFSPHQPIRVNFLNDQYARAYDDVKRFGMVVTIFATLAIVVASLGLFGLSAFLIQQRSKEISIRLVLGASLTNILRLLTQNFLVLVLISVVIAAPMAWYLMDVWLSEYAYKIPITPDAFVLTALTTLGVAIVTVSYQSIKASLTNPAVNLKSE